MTRNSDNSSEEMNFGEFRRKVRAAEVLSASMEQLLLALRFTGRVSVVMQNGRVLKSGLRGRILPAAGGGRRRGRVRAEILTWKESRENISRGGRPSKFPDELRGSGVANN